MTLIEKEKAIKKVPEGWICSLSAYRKLVDWVKPEYLDMHKDWDTESILDMIRYENRLARRQH